MMSIPLETVKQLLQQQIDDFTSMVSALMESFNSRYDLLKTTVIEIKHSLEYSQKQIEETLKRSADQESSITYLKNELVLVRDKYDDVTSKLDY